MHNIVLCVLLKAWWKQCNIVSLVCMHLLSKLLRFAHAVLLFDLCSWVLDHEKTIIYSHHHLLINT